MQYLTRFDQVRAILGEPNPVSRNKIKTQLNERMTAFIQAAPLMMLSTIGSDGFPTLSPKGDSPGFVSVQDPQTLLIPERKGNKLAFGFANLLDNSKAGLIFLVPGTSETLRIHGNCRLIHDEALCEQLASSTQPALLVMEFSIVNCYFHCGKALLRSQAWSPESWGARQTVSFGEEMYGHSPEQARTVSQMDETVKLRYKTDL